MSDDVPQATAPSGQHKSAPNGLQKSMTFVYEHYYWVSVEHADNQLTSNGLQQ